MTVSDKSAEHRLCLLPPIPELYDAARALQEAVEAHVKGRSDDARIMIKSADHPAIFEWSETLFGGKTIPRPIKDAVFRLCDDPEKPEAVPKELQVPGTPPAAIRRQVIERDGYFCRYCGLPVISQPAQAALRKAYPDELRWGRANTEKHTAFQALDLDWEHVVPRSLGGQNTLDNLIVACSPCNTGKWNWTLAELSLADPRERPAKRLPGFEDWAGMTQILMR